MLYEAFIVVKRLLYGKMQDDSLQQYIETICSNTNKKDEIAV